MTAPGAAWRAGLRHSRARHSPRRRGLIGWLTGLTLALALLAPGLPAVADAARPAAPMATPSATSPAPSASPSTTGTPGPRPDPEGDRWIQLAVVGGGSLLGAVLMFMVIGGIIRGVNRQRARR